MHVKNLTCHNSAGIAIGSLGQYYGVRDVVENITAEDVTLIGSRNGAYIKTYVGKPTYYPPQGGGGGNGFVRNIGSYCLYVSHGYETMLTILQSSVTFISKTSLHLQSYCSSAVGGQVTMFHHAPIPQQRVSSPIYRGLTSPVCPPYDNINIKPANEFHRIHE
jgi:hypothetical protein